MSKHPAWLDNAIFYEIYPQSFYDSNGDGIGDIQGIISKLDYIRELGCNALWLNPCFDSPFLDAGYDVSDYYKVAPRYGTNDDLFLLFDEAHKRGMHIFLDLVPGHTSWEHPWFKASMKAARNEYTDRYVWTDNVWESLDGYGSLRGISERHGSCVVNFFSHQPALNYGFLKPEKPWQQSMDAEGPRKTLQAMMDVMRFWLSHGCDGFRVDMAGSLVKKDTDSFGTIALWQKVRDFLDREFPDVAMISEWGEPDKSLQAGFQMDFLLHFGPSHYNDLFRCEEPYFSARGKGDVTAFAKKYLEYRNKSENKGLICIPSGNHDMERLARRLHGDELKMAFAFLLTMPGAPFIYYGDEIGMRYVEGLTSVEGGYERTGSRSPMQWDDSVNAGFSTAPAEKLYIPLDAAADRPAVSAQIADQDSLLNEVKRLTALRQAHPALQNYGEIEFIHIGYPLIYKRSFTDEILLVIINPSAEEKRIVTDQMTDQLTDQTIDQTTDQMTGSCIYQLNGAARREGNSIVVPAQSACIMLP
jgi:glycosidase